MVIRRIWLLALVVLARGAGACVPGQPTGGLPSNGGRSSATRVRMGPAEEGPFTPLCLAGKVVLGQTTFNKYRGKIISYHSG